MNSIRSRRAVGSSYATKSPLLSPATRGRQSTSESRPTSTIRLKPQEKPKSVFASDEPVVAAPAGTVEDTHIPKGNIRVCVRVRPINQNERQTAGNDSCVQVLDNRSIQIRQVTQDHTGLTQRTLPTLSFDLTASPDMSQSDFFHRCGVTELVDAALQGFASTVFAYGQTGSGKTYTMTGTEQKDGSATDENMGLMPRTFAYLGERIAALEAQTPGMRFLLRASYMELYNEQIKDLIAPANADLSLRQKIHGQNTVFFVEGLSVVQCGGIGDLAAVAREGHLNRHVAAHNLNQHSSRSHSIFTVYIECRQMEQGDDASQVLQWVRYGKLTFVDLAGSENLRSSGIFSNADGHVPTDKQRASGAAHMRETAAINRSLFALGAVMSVLSGVHTGRKPPNTFIPYRNSKLTMILQDSLGGSALTMMLACVSPAGSCAEESRRTLTYAATCKNIANKPQVAVDPRTALLLKYKDQARQLQEENNMLRAYIVAQGMPVPEFADDEHYTATATYASPSDYTATAASVESVQNAAVTAPSREGAYSAMGRQGAVSVAEGTGTVANSGTGTGTGTCARCSTYIPPSLEVLRENAKLRVRMQRIVDVLVRLGAAGMVGLSGEELQAAQTLETLKGAAAGPGGHGYGYGEGEEGLYVCEEEIRDLDWHFSPEGVARPSTQHGNTHGHARGAAEASVVGHAADGRGHRGSADGPEDGRARVRGGEQRAEGAEGGEAVLVGRASSANEATLLSLRSTHARALTDAATDSVATAHDPARGVAGGRRESTSVEKAGERERTSGYAVPHRRTSLGIPPNELEQMVAKLQVREAELKKTAKELEQRVRVLQEEVMETSNGRKREKTKGNVTTLEPHKEKCDDELNTVNKWGLEVGLVSDMGAPVVVNSPISCNTPHNAKNRPPPSKSPPPTLLDNNEYEFDTSVNDILGLTPPTKPRSLTSASPLQSHGDLGKILTERVAAAATQSGIDPVSPDDMAAYYFNKSKSK